MNETMMRLNQRFGFIYFSNDLMPSDSNEIKKNHMDISQLNNLLTNSSRLMSTMPI